MIDKKSYYAIIPANVRYDKNLTANAKLLYGEITALCNEKGYCWASNSYFAELYEVSKQSVSVWINSLHKNGYIDIEMIRKGKEITKRKVSIKTGGVSINLDEGINKSLIGYQENLKENNTSNTTVNNKDNIQYIEIIDYLNSQSGSRYRNTDSTRRLIHARFNEGFTKEDFFKVIDNKVRSWKGTEWEKFLRPETLFCASKFQGYLNEKPAKTASMRPDFSVIGNVGGEEKTF
jgi:uncharacterized phage protein (TIGR02220 family)